MAYMEHSAHFEYRAVNSPTTHDINSSKGIYINASNVNHAIKTC